jgi:hypothetical protein
MEVFLSELTGSQIDAIIADGMCSRLRETLGSEIPQQNLAWNSSE